LTVRFAAGPFTLSYVIVNAPLRELRTFGSNIFCDPTAQRMTA
jgi:hypothetical protein